jgi:hypothetical protein
VFDQDDIPERSELLADARVGGPVVYDDEIEIVVNLST